MFTAVRCPQCARVVLEAGPGYRGLTRVKCQCKRRVWVLGDELEVRVGMVDTPKRDLRQA